MTSAEAAKVWRDAERRRIEQAAGVTIENDGRVRLVPRGSIAVMCGWCGVAIGWRDGRGTTGISHSICPDCEARVWADPDATEHE